MGAGSMLSMGYEDDPLTEEFMTCDRCFSVQPFLASYDAIPLWYVVRLDEAPAIYRDDRVRVV